MNEMNEAPVNQSITDMINHIRDIDQSPISMDTIIDLIKFIESRIIDEERVWTYPEIAEEVMNYLNFQE